MEMDCDVENTKDDAAIAEDTPMETMGVEDSEKRSAEPQIETSSTSEGDEQMQSYNADVIAQSPPPTPAPAPPATVPEQSSPRSNSVQKGTCVSQASESRLRNDRLVSFRPRNGSHCNPARIIQPGNNND
jgi:hypothetical protein